MDSLRAAFADLDDLQRDAVRHGDNTVVLAGPGSGKTATLVVKVAHLMREIVDPPFGVACITYSNETVREFSVRLQTLGIRPERRLFLGTVHGFCLNSILLPFGRLADEPWSDEMRVLTGGETERLAADALRLEGHTDTVAQFSARLSKIRKAIACDDDLDAFDPFDVRVAQRYEDQLEEHQALDFEAMVLRSLSLLQDQPIVRRLLAARFKWIAVDEYQDLGGVLHSIVRLLEAAGVRVFAVGDVDQLLYEFAGADARYLRQLESDEDYRTVRLQFNYRSGARLIAASQAALAPDPPRNYRPAPDCEDAGEIVIETVPGDLVDQAAYIVDTAIPAAQQLDIELHEIAVLYPRRGVLLDALKSALEESDFEFLAERDGRYPRARIVVWLQRCVHWALERESAESDPFYALYTDFRRFLRDARRDVERDDLNSRVRLYRAIKRPVDPDDSLSDWLRDVRDALDLDGIASASQSRREEADALAQLRSAADDASLRLADFAGGLKVRNRVTLTTYHSSKGRQFDVVILPGLQEVMMPWLKWNRTRRRYESSQASLREQRRQFYVAFTRARRVVYMLSSPTWTNDYGYPVHEGRSRFVDEIERRLETYS